jgi:ribonucleotide reductase beta subunit family protein with ferritin-like domain
MSSSSELFTENPDRFVVYPIQHPKLWDLFMKQKECWWWDVEVVPDQRDERDWSNATPEERMFIENILAFFATADSIVNENLAQQFMAEVQIPEARMFYSIQIMNETIHNLVYTKLLESYVSDEDHRLHLFRGLHTIPAVKQITDWTRAWISDTIPFEERLVAFICVEGLLFSGMFCSIYWLNERGILPAISFANKLIARDEGLHTDFGILLYTQYCTQLSTERAHEIIRGALEASITFITESLPCSLIGLSKERMVEYVTYVANRLTTRLGHDPLERHTIQPFPFMEHINLTTKENFFENRVSNYRLSVNTVDTSELEFDIDV